MPRIRVITFDLDNTLWDVYPVITGAERRMAQWLEARAPEVMALFREGGEITQIREALMAEQPALIHDVTKLRQELTYRCLRYTGRDERTAKRLTSGAFEVFLNARHEIEFFAGAIDALEALARNYTLGSLTNGNADPKRLGLDKYFSFGFSAADVGVGKPAPAMFEAALSHQNVQASEAVHVGDHPVDDIQGARNVGMHTVWANGAMQQALHGQQAEVEPTVEIERLDQLEDALRHIEDL